MAREGDGLAGDAAPEEAGPDQPELDSQLLFRGSRQLVIVHNQERYVLRITRQGKLILNK